MSTIKGVGGRSNNHKIVTISQISIFKRRLFHIYWDFRTKFCCVKKHFGFYFDLSERRNEFLTRQKIVSSNHKPRLKRIVFSRAFSRSSQIPLSGSFDKIRYWYFRCTRVVRNSNLSRARIYIWGRLNLSMHEINKLQHGKRARQGFSHSLVKYQKSHSFAALSRSISDTAPTRVKIPYARAFHEVISIFVAVAVVAA